MKSRRLALLLLASAVHAASPDPFEFVVVGDTRPRFESENFRQFESLIPKINALEPAFVVNLGDLIYGYGLLSKKRQWDNYERVVRGIRAPYHQVPGNHDTYSKRARRVYGRRFGKFYGSFDYGECHFVLLDNTEDQRWGRMGAAQLDWLKRDLGETKARSVYVFLHFPVWEPERVTPQSHELWTQTLHPLFREARVRAVFGGHFHSYGPTRELDGIRYYITGGGGAELRPAYRKSGGEHHFLRVKVSGDTGEIRVVTARGELTDAEADVMGGLRFADRHSSRIGLRQGARELRAGASCSLSLSNPYPAVLEGKAEWNLDARVFSVRPRTIPVRVPVNGTQRLTFTLQTLTDKVPMESLPWLEFDVRATGRHHRFHREVLFLQGMDASYQAPPPVLDGRLGDWAGVDPMRLGEGSKSAAQLRAVHDGDSLSLAVTLPARSGAEQDESAFRDDLQIGIAGRLDETEFGSDVLRLGIACSAGAPEVKDRTPGAEAAGVVPGARCACQTTGGRTTCEIRIPLRLLRGLRTGAGHSLILNLSFPVPDGETKEPVEPEPNSLSYQVRYGGDSLVPVHFVELFLERKEASPGARPAAKGGRPSGR